MKFTKMHGLGNDFILMYCNKELPHNVSRLAIELCDRHTGIGADGLVVMTPSVQADICMHIFNADGTEAEQCGNAIRCVAKYVREKLDVQNKMMHIETRRQIQTVWIQEDGEVRVDMGLPITQSDQIPVNLNLREVIHYPLQIEGRTFPVTCVSMGNPHTVIEVSEVETIPLEVWGPQIEHHPLFPKKTNVEFITIRSPHEVIMRVWERGVGRTQACGSGACAAVVVGILWKKLKRSVLVQLEGGRLHIEWDEDTNRIYMTGPAKVVFEGAYS